MRAQVPCRAPRCVGKQRIGRLILAGLDVARRSRRPEFEPPKRRVLENKRQVSPQERVGLCRANHVQWSAAGELVEPAHYLGFREARRSERAIGDHAKDLVAGGRDIDAVDPNAKSAAIGTNALDLRTCRYDEFVPRPRAPGIPPQHDECRSRLCTGPTTGLRRISVPTTLPERTVLVPDHQQVAPIC